MVKIVLDCFGGDLSPDANVQGAVNSLNANEDITLVLTGDEKILKEKLSGLKYDGQRLIIENAPEVVSCDEKPTEAIKRKDTSLGRALELTAKDESVSGMVSLGSTGVVLAGAVLKVGRIKGVLRPAFCPVLPTMSGSFVAICDSGANAECKPEYLKQFAVMGSRYMEAVYGLNSARVALLNIGAEDEKGDTLRKEAFSLIKKENSVNFVGNMESRDLLSGKYDLVVADGFSGNVLLKSTEGACLEVLKMLKREINASFSNKIGGLFLRKSLMQKKEFMDYRNYAGGIMLGVKKTIIKCHGNGTAVTVEKCIEQAYKTHVGGLIENIARDLAE